MARVNLSPIFNDSRGPIGPWTFSKWRGTQVLKARPSTPDQETESRMEVRKAYGRLCEVWGSLSSAIQIVWDIYSVAWGISGFNAFIKKNLALELAGSLLIIIPEHYSTLPVSSFQSQEGAAGGDYKLVWSSPYSGPDYTAWIFIRPSGKNELTELTQGTLQLDTEEYSDSLYNRKIHFDETTASYMLSTRAQKIDKGTFACICNLNNFVSDVGHNMDLFIPYGSGEDRGIEIGFGNDISDLDLFITGEKHHNWNTYYVQGIDHLVTKGKDFSVITEWEFIPGNSIVNFYIDGVLVTGATYENLTNWDENFSPDQWQFGDEEPPYADRIVDGEMDAIHVFNRWLEDWEKQVLAKGGDLRNDALAAYLFDNDTCNDYSPNHNNGSLGGNADLDDYASTKDFQAYLIVEPVAPPGAPVPYSVSASCFGNVKPDA